MQPPIPTAKLVWMQSKGAGTQWPWATVGATAGDGFKLARKNFASLNFNLGLLARGVVFLGDWLEPLGMVMLKSTRKNLDAF